MQNVNHTVAMSGPDKAALRDVLPGAPITVIPNGVDLLEYSGFDGTCINHDMVFTGKMANGR